MSLEEKIVWGGFYKVKHNRWLNTSGYNDQIYKQAVPVRRKDGSIWMQDTYQIEKHYSRCADYIQMTVDLQDPEKGEYVIRHSRNWYLKSNEQIDESILDKDYELICDLKQYRILDYREDARYYKSDDVIDHVHLFNEHGYRNSFNSGITIVKKYAQPDELCEFIAMKEDISTRFDYPNSFGNLEDFIAKHDSMIKKNVRIPPKLEHDYQKCIWMHNKLKQMNKEIKEYTETHVYHFNWIFGNTKVGDIHEDISRYLTEGCYCPNEVYDYTGHFYIHLYDSNICKLIHKDDKFLVVVAVFYSESMSEELVQIVLFELENEKISDCMRLDVTQNNIKCVSEIIKFGKSTNKFNNYPKYTFPEDIQNLITNWKI